MKYQCILVLIQSLFVYGAPDQLAIPDYEQKCRELQLAQQQLQQYSVNGKGVVLDNIEMYGRCAAQLALSIMSVVDCSKLGQASTNRRFNILDTKNTIRIVISCFLIAVEIARGCQARKLYKRMIATMKHQDFVIQFPHLILVEYQIILMKTLLRLMDQGTFPEQIFARIQLAQMSLPYPYEKVADKCACKLYKHTFDKKGRVVFVKIHEHDHPYKKFFKKVPQNWQEIALKADSFGVSMQQNNYSSVASLVDNEYNNLIIKIIHAGMQRDAVRLHELMIGSPIDSLFKQLFDYYRSII